MKEKIDLLIKELKAKDDAVKTNQELNDLKVL